MSKLSNCCRLIARESLTKSDSQTESNRAKIINLLQFNLWEIFMPESEMVGMASEIVKWLIHTYESQSVGYWDTS